MKFRTIALGALSLIIFIPLLLIAEDHQAILQELAEKKNWHVLEVMMTMLNLNPAQEAEIKTALDDQTKKMFDLQKEYADKEKAVHDAAEAQILSSLADDQKTKYPQVKAALEKEQAQQLGEPYNFNGQDGSGGGHRKGLSGNF